MGGLNRSLDRYLSNTDGRQTRRALTVHPPDSDRNSHKKRRPNINKRENEAEMMVSTSFAPCTTKGNSRQTLDFLTGTQTHWGQMQLRNPKDKTVVEWRAADNSRNPE